MMQEAGTAEATSNGTAKQNGLAAEGVYRDVRSKSTTLSSDITAANLMTLQQQQVIVIYLITHEGFGSYTWFNQSQTHSFSPVHVIHMSLSLLLSAH